MALLEYVNAFLIDYVTKSCEHHLGDTHYVTGPYMLIYRFLDLINPCSLLDPILTFKPLLDLPNFPTSL